MKPKGTFCVVVSYYNARPPENLHKLLQQLQSLRNERLGRHQEFRVKIVVSVNEVQDGHYISDPVDASMFHVVRQPNQGFNIGAWDFGFRQFDSFDQYLFLQDECQLVNPNALDRYWQLLTNDTRGILLGESMQVYSGWNKFRRTWPEAFEAIQAIAKAKSWDTGKSATHMQTLAIGLSKRSLERLEGYPHADDKIDAIACEVLLSRRCIQLGMSLRQSACRPFEYFRHPQWDDERTRMYPLKWFLNKIRRVFCSA